MNDFLKNFHNLNTKYCYTINIIEIKRNIRLRKGEFVMSDFDNGQKPDLGQNPELQYRENEQGGISGYQQEPVKRQPEYNFWAERISDNTKDNGSANPSWGYQSGYQNGYQNYTYNPNQTINVQDSKKPRKKGPFRFIAKAVSFGLIACVTFLIFQSVYYVVNPGARKSSYEADQNIGDILNIDPPAKDVPEVENTSVSPVELTERTVITKVVENTMPAIVSIRVASKQEYNWFGQSYEQEVEGSGSGIIVGQDEKELLIATNNHVVEGAATIAVDFIDGTEAEAIIKGTDPIADLAVVAIDISKIKKETLDAITVAKLGNSDDVSVGEMSIAIGNALGYGQSVTVGYISAKDRDVSVSDGYETKTMVLLQTDAAINPGNSGGALLNIKGEVIGINTIKYASNDVEGMGYAIPISRAIPIIEELKTRETLSAEEQGYLGITGSDVTEDVSVSYNMPIGVFVYEASPGGAADKAGIKQGDIITKLNDMEITSITQLKEKVNSMRIGTEVKITLMRNTNGSYEEQEITVVLGERPKVNTETLPEN
ncbi:MAG: hypothetical protein K0S47_2434 [Herbinix sp.]|nr:hypothetical protein [Herbinix sp.]